MQPTLYDENQYIIRINYLDDLYNRIYINTGYSAVLRTVDKYGNILTETYLDLKDSPVKCNSGYASQRNTWDALGRIIKQEYLDVAIQ